MVDFVFKDVNSELGICKKKCTRLANLIEILTSEVGDSIQKHRGPGAEHPRTRVGAPAGECGGRRPYHKTTFLFMFQNILREKKIEKIIPCFFPIFWRWKKNLRII